jgi:hypothetical protein
MRRFIPGLIVLGLPLISPDPAAAQQQDQPTPVVLATYFRCDGSRAERASEIVRTVFAPLTQKHVTSGQLSAWGLLAHNTGGAWRRAVYYIGTDRAAVMAARDSIVSEAVASHAKEANEFTSICPSHDDYIWTWVAGSQPATDVATARPKASFSTYQICHEGSEGIYDETMKSLYAPIYDKQVKAGRISSWTVLAHFVGGKYRRLLVMDGADFDSILAARDSIIEDTQAQYPAIGAAVSEACDGHSDYMWDIEMAKP